MQPLSRLPIIAKGCPGDAVGQWRGRAWVSNTTPFQFLSYCFFHVDEYDFQFFLLYFLYFKFSNSKSISLLCEIMNT